MRSFKAVCGGGLYGNMIVFANHLYCPEKFQVFVISQC